MSVSAKQPASETASQSAEERAEKVEVEIKEPGTTEEAEADPVSLLIEERDAFKDRLLRTAADFDNFRKRSRKDVSAAEIRGKESVIRELLPVFDNLERAVAASEGATDIDSVIEGVQMVLGLFADSTRNLGLERVPTVGERFDPTIHEAIQRIQSAEHPPGTVVAEVVPGYRLKERLVRAAMVVVAQKPVEQAVDEVEA